MNIEGILDMIDQVLEEAWTLPLSGGRSVIDADVVRDLIDDIRLNMPMEIKHAQALVADRAHLMEKAKKDVDAIIKKAEERARQLIDKDEITINAKKQAAEIISAARLQSNQIRKVSTEYTVNLIDKTEKALLTSLNEVRNVKKQMKMK